MKRIVGTAMSLAILMASGYSPALAQQTQQYQYVQIQVQPQQQPQQTQPASEATRHVIVVPTQTSPQTQTIQGQVQQAMPLPLPAPSQTPQQILDRLRVSGQLPQQINPTIRIVESNSLNAATDGRQIVITSALWNRLHTDDQRAFVISHELAHVVLEHVGRTQARRLGLGLLDALVLRRYIPEGTLAQMAANLGINLYDLRSARHYEYQADDLGMQLLTRAGYNPQAAIDVFRVLHAATPGNSQPEFLRSHPMTESRIRALVQKYQLSLN